MNKVITSSSSGGIGFIGVLTIAFIVLKLIGQINWSWWWVLSPIWISVSFILGVILHKPACKCKNDESDYYGEMSGGYIMYKRKYRCLDCDNWYVDDITTSEFKSHQREEKLKRILEYEKL